MNDFQRILVLGPHTDDGELGCGGTIARFIEEGREVYYATFSACEESVPEGFHPEVLLDEWKAASKALGIPEENLFSFRFQVRYFPRDRQLILEDMVKLNKLLNPDLVLLPRAQDVHQDHGVIHKEGIRAFKNSTLMGYELPWNSLLFHSNFHVKLMREHVETKIKAISCYESQAFRSYIDREFIVGLARTRGIQINEEFAEAFTLIRGIMR